MLLTYDIISEILKHLEYPDIKNFLQVNLQCAKYMKTNRNSQISQIRSKFIKQKFTECILFSCDYFYKITFGQTHDPPEKRKYTVLEYLDNIIDNPKDDNLEYFVTHDKFICEPDSMQEMHILISETKMDGDVMKSRKNMGISEFLSYLYSKCNTITIHISCNVEFFKHQLERLFPEFIKFVKFTNIRNKTMLYVEDYYDYLHDFLLTFNEEEYTRHLINRFNLTQNQMNIIQNTKKLEKLDSLFCKIRQNTQKVSLMTLERQDERKQLWDKIKYSMDEINDNDEIETCYFYLKIDLKSILRYM